MQDVQNIQLHLLALFVFIKGHRAYQNVQFFSPYNFCSRALHLLRCQVRQKVCNAEDRISCIFPDIYSYRSAVCFYHNAVQGEGNCCPLILFNAAVVMGFEHCQFMILVQRILLHIQTGGIDMRSTQANAFCNRCGADDSCNDCLAPVVYIDFIAGFQRHARSKRHKSVVFQQCRGCYHSFPFCFGCIQKCNVIRCKSIAFCLLCGINPQSAVFCLCK